MKVLVLGGNGFIGSHVVDSLLFAGHRVRIFDRLEDRYRGRLSGVDYVLGTFDDTLLLAEALADIDVVFHGISTTVPSTSNTDPVGDVQTNLLASIRLLQVMLQNGVSRIVYLSSGGTVYGRANVDFIPESHPLQPICSYGVIKVAIESYLHMFQELYGLRPTVLRPSNPYGERQGHTGVQGVIGTFLNKIARNERIEIWGDGSVVRDFIYVPDLADVCLKAIESPVTGVFNVGGGCGYSIRDIFEAVVAVSGTGARPNYMQSRGFDVNRVVLDISRAKETFGWHPRTPLLQGINRTWTWLDSLGAKR